MGGNITGGQRAARTNKEKYGDDFYARIGKIGGQKSTGGGFGSDKIGPDGLTGRQRASSAGRKGGVISRRGKIN